jgi:hypothetical protein
LGCGGFKVHFKILRQHPAGQPWSLAPGPRWALFSLEDTMMTMSDAAMRTIVDIPEKQLDALAQLCAQQNISRAEAVRRAVDRLLKESSTPRKDAGFGIWKSKRIDSLKFVEKLRAEWSER